MGILAEPDAEGSGLGADPVLSADGLVLRPFRLGDAHDIAFLRHIADDPVSWQWSRSLRRIADQDAAQEWIAERLATTGTLEFVVEDAETGAALGRVGLHRHGDDADLEVGYWTAPGARGRGVARRAARLVARHAHEVLGVDRVALVHAVANPASCRAALGASFRHEGTMRAALDHGDGIAHDMHVHARLADDSWDPLPPPVSPGGLVDVAGDGVLLRPWEQADARALLAAAADPLVMTWNPFEVQTSDQARRWIDQARAWSGFAVWAICVPGDRSVRGNISLHHLDSVNASAEAGYWVMAEARGRGVGGRALRAATDFAVRELGIERVDLYHAVENTASCRVAERAGFALEGLTRRSHRYGDGELHDEHLHAWVVGDP